MTRPMVGREALAEILYLGGNQLVLGPVSGERFRRLTLLVEEALSDTDNRGGSSVLSLVSDLPPSPVPVRKVTRYIIEDGQCTEAAELNRRQYGACPATFARVEAARAADDARVLATLPGRCSVL
ncbi:hypothetical protein [Streptomyces noursei]|uniref:hypothetical protein n=1 Tax=Streptomyces noursei TaxID=1971 RepID=UPI00167BC07A|nr:hypothetical protein [Streptomyces noursei]MCZ1014118.1 hypothetical protein [Streptomyces noursei]